MKGCRIPCSTHLIPLLLFLKKENNACLILFQINIQKEIKGFMDFKQQKSSISDSWNHNKLLKPSIFCTHTYCYFYLWCCFYRSAPSPPTGSDHYCLLSRAGSYGWNHYFWRSLTLSALDCFYQQKMRRLKQKQPSCCYTLFTDQRKTNKLMNYNLSFIVTLAYTFSL